MKVLECLKLSTSYSSSILLHREGLFYRMYNESAYLFSRYIKSFKVTECSIKVMDVPYYVVGFPFRSLEGLFTNYTVVTCSGGYLRIDSPSFVFVDADYQIWRSNSHDLSAAAKKGKEVLQDMSINTITTTNVSANPPDADLISILKELYSFRINSSTPLECVNFLSNLQDRLNGKI